jgi:hypothetical protein
VAERVGQAGIIIKFRKFRKFRPKKLAESNQEPRKPAAALVLYISEQLPAGPPTRHTQSSDSQRAGGGHFAPANTAARRTTVFAVGVSAGSRKAPPRKCDHGRRIRRCKDCGTGQCKHNRQKSQCKDCGTGHCEHGRPKGQCSDCKYTYFLDNRQIKNSPACRAVLSSAARCIGTRARTGCERICLLAFRGPWVRMCLVVHLALGRHAEEASSLARTLPLKGLHSQGLRKRQKRENGTKKAASRLKAFLRMTGVGVNRALYISNKIPGKGKRAKSLAMKRTFRLVDRTSTETELPRGQNARTIVL